MKKQYSYSNDKVFLSKIDILQIKEQWVKITLLDYKTETPIESIEGKITDGTLSKAGDSSVRRTCSLNCAVDAFKYKPDDIKSSYSISKKIYLELGITNDTKDYPDEKIIWFPQGVFFITDFSIAASATGAASISLQLKDKMAQFDGTVGGILPATVRFDTVTTITDGTIITNKALVYDIIMETVNHFGGEDLSNIIIDDVPTKAKRIIRWMGEEPVWIYPIIGENNQVSYNICYDSDLENKKTAYKGTKINGSYVAAKKYETNQDIGYMYEDFVYDEELTFQAGAKITDVLDKIKEWLGNYEYFYDEQGQFHFQEIKNYLNNKQSAEIWNKIQGTSDLDYLYESTYGEPVYTFDDNVNLISITNKPSYENIKNDFIVEGTAKNNGINHVCRYHLVIDDKPTITTEGYDNVLMYTDPATGSTTIGKPIIITPVQSNGKWRWLLPEFAEDGKIYGLLDEPQSCVYKKTLKNIDEFASYYHFSADLENDLNSNIKQSDFVREYLFSLLEKYMGYKDDTAYKEKYKDIIFTLARHLKDDSSEDYSKRTPLTTTIEYYNALWARYAADIVLYQSNPIEIIQRNILQNGGLLSLLYELFDGIEEIYKPKNPHVDYDYWPSVKQELNNQLWDGISTSINSKELRIQRKERCQDYAAAAELKQQELKILVDQYGEILSNYDTLIAAERRNGKTDDELSEDIETRNLIQDQINACQILQQTCYERSTMLYAILTLLGVPDTNMGEMYYSVNIEIPVRSTSFWYYNNDNSQNTYGWNELSWYQYYHSQTESTEYYPDGLGSMTYIDYSKINWYNFEVGEEGNNPSMNRYSNWYRNYYINYAKENDLPYFDENLASDQYVPINWRTELLLMGLKAEENGTDPGDYYQELKANWPIVYDFKNEQLLPSSIDYLDYFVGNTGVVLGNEYQWVTEDNNNQFNAEDDDDPDTPSTAKFKPGEIAEIKNALLNYENGSYYYFFDMIDSSSPTWGEYSVKNIGRRSNVNKKQGVNCIFAPRTPDYAFLNLSGLTLNEQRAAYAELANIAEEIIQITDDLYKNFATGGLKQSAYEQIKYDLQQYTSYQNTITATAIPCFYLEPNTRVKINDESTGTFGDYVVKSISIPLGVNSNMSVNMSKAMERI